MSGITCEFLQDKLQKELNPIHVVRILIIFHIFNSVILDEIGDNFTSRNYFTFSIDLTIVQFKMNSN